MSIRATLANIYDTIKWLFKPSDYALSPERQPFVPTHRHVKTGGLYRVLETDALLEATLTPCVVYEHVDGTIWIRPKEEFFDGRFVEVDPNTRGGISYV